MKLFDFNKKGIPHSLKISSVLLSIVLVAYILSVTSFFNPIVYPLIDRVTYETPFAEKNLFGKYLDQILILLATSFWLFISVKNKFGYILSFIYGLSALITIFSIIPQVTEIITLISFPLMSLLIILNKFFKKDAIYFDSSYSIDILSAIGIIFGILGLVISAFHIMAPDMVLPAINYFYYIYLIFSIISPVLLVIIALSFPIAIFIYKFPKLGEKLRSSPNVFSISSSDTLKLNRRILSLIGIIVLSLVIVWIPHVETINQDNQIIGSDTKDYAKFLTNMTSSTSIQAITNEFFFQIQGDRALSLITFYALSHILYPSNLILSLELLPLVLAPLLILSFYFLTMEFTSNHFTSILSSFLAAISFQVMIGVYGGFYANWLALIFVNFAILFLIRSIRIPSRKNIIILSILLVVVLLSHEPTWPIITMVIIMFLTILLVFSSSLKKSIYFLFLAIIPSFCIELFKTVFMQNSGLLKNVSFASTQGLGFHDLSTIWNNLVASTQTYLAGQFNNSIIYGLVIYWISTCTINDKSNLFILIFLSIPILPILFADPEVISRVLYEIPFSIPAAIALVQLMKNHGNILFLSVCLWLIALSVRSSSNFYFEG